MDAINTQTKNMLVNSQVFFLNVASVAALLGWNRPKIKKSVDSGLFLWTFNFSFATNAGEPRLNGLRWWVGELAEPKAVREFTLERVIQEILGTTRFNFEPGDICRRFQISKVQLGKVREELNAPLGKIKRPDLVEFLEKRWTGSHQKRGGNN